MKRGIKSLALGAGVGLGILIVALLVQHWRHGWPFSLHHGVAAVPAPVLAATSAASEPDRVAVTLTASQGEHIGIRLAPVQSADVRQQLRAVATVVPDESRIMHVHARVAGWLENLHVNTTGQTVRAGDVLAEIFSQELLATQNEYLAALRSSPAEPASVVVAAAKSRLQTLGMTATEIADIERRGEAKRVITVVAPGSGVVLRRNVSVGTSVDPSTELVTLADLSQVWVLADIAESASTQVAVDTPAILRFAALGDKPLRARVAFVYPTLSERSRTLRVRFLLPNREGSLRPGLFGEAEFEAVQRKALLVPRDAVVDTGRKQYVYIASNDRYEPREVQLGMRVAEQIEILNGVAEGELLVASGVFLLDSESRLQATGSVGGEHGAHAQPASQPITQPAAKPATPAPVEPEHRHGDAEPAP
ncbi:MAG: efflux RND transporter periplasmic adaptor subunit [Pseudomonadota bacterium]